MAVRAPSVHNSQPWRWRVDDTGTLNLYADRSRHLPATDPDSRDLMLSCGATLHHCVVALASLGWRAAVQRFPDPHDPHHLARITVTPGPPSETDLKLAAAIDCRRTDRRHYGSTEVCPADIALIGMRVARMGVTMRRVESIEQLNGLVEQAISKHISDDAYLTELTRWSGRYRSLAGVPAHSTPAPDHATTVPGRVFAGPALAQPPHRSGATENAAVLALGTHADDAQARLRAGEATSLVLLTATTLGLATCPITEPLEVAHTRSALREEFFDDREYPQMLIRIGWPAEQAAPLPATPRRPAL
ncbi:NAD(P)H nitroreductase [Mycobacterium sp. NS-7484]|uniref:Acg family FMN-binding oxidoreductase n=1 Tax=Mycobacterium sp. NS-7484 TaxID=1834161 RepID=UPI00096CE4E9|nr:NAD(P)H nitroreductase [Mycobacterium sp. NS-7484]OMB95406.1 NAD(P)H nitroreductase [Mycobacterium sp. NS-7484]